MAGRTWYWPSKFAHSALAPTRDVIPRAWQAEKIGNVRTRSSGEQSTGFLNRGSEVRTSPGSPVDVRHRGHGGVLQWAERPRSDRGQCEFESHRPYEATPPEDGSGDGSRRGRSSGVEHCFVRAEVDGSIPFVPARVSWRK